MMPRWMHVALSVALLGSQRALAYGPKTEGQKKEERFVHCILAIEESDKNKDDQLSRHEYQPFVRYLSQLMFDQAVIEENELPKSLGRLYKTLIPVSGAKYDAQTIDIFGARMDELNRVSEERLHRLRSVCQMVMQELAKLGPRTDAPLQMMDFMETEEEFEEEGEEEAQITAVAQTVQETEGDLEFKHEQEVLQTEMISVHSSFLISNMHALSPQEIDIGHTSVLYNTYVDFINSMLGHICPSGIACPEDLEMVKQQEKQQEQQTHPDHVHVGHVIAQDQHQAKQQQQELAKQKEEEAKQKQQELAKKAQEEAKQKQQQEQLELARKRQEEAKEKEQEQQQTKPLSYEEQLAKRQQDQQQPQQQEEEEPPQQQEEEPPQPRKPLSYEEQLAMSHEEEQKQQALEQLELAKKRQEEAQKKEEEAEEEVEEAEEEVEIIEEEEEETGDGIMSWLTGSGSEQEETAEEEEEQENKEITEAEQQEEQLQQQEEDGGGRALFTQPHERRLCGNPHRRALQDMVCGDTHEKVVKAAVFSDADLYLVTDHECPIGLRRHSADQGGGVIPKCSMVYAHYDVTIHHVDADIQQIQHNYDHIAMSAIAAGMLQASLDKIDPDNKNKFEILGAGQYRYPHDNDHHVAGASHIKDKNHPHGHLRK